MSLIEERESFASKLERLTAKVDAELAELMDPKQHLDRSWGLKERKSHTKLAVRPPKPKRVKGANPHWERW